MNIFNYIVTFLFASLMFLVSASYGAKNLDYYSLHPKALEKALVSCDTKPLASCQQLRDLAGRLNELAVALRTNPLDYGQTILKLQTAMTSSTVQPAYTILANQQNLRERLAVIKWLESPGG